MSDSSEVMNLGATLPTPELDGLLARSLIAMLLADDQRRYVDVNEAACALLGLSRAELLEAGVDGLTPVALRGRVPALWDRFLEQGTMQGVYELTDASGRVIRITYVAIARVLPGLHLSCLLTARSPESAGALSRRERDVVTLAAQGLTSNEIAHTLSLSRATVETHFRNAVRRLSARNRAHAIALALTRGEIALPAAREVSARGPEPGRKRNAAPTRQPG
jgi:PAS domain S-box-containing protein